MAKDGDKPSISMILEHVMDLKGGENSHLDAALWRTVDFPQLVGNGRDLGQQTRKFGWTNIGDISACLRTCVGLGEIYQDSDTPYVAVASKHTRPVIIAKGRTQLEAAVKAIAGDLNSPFGGFWGFNTPLEYNTAEFLDKMFFEGVAAPDFEQGADSLLSDSSVVNAHKDRFLLQTGSLSSSGLHPRGYNLQPVAGGYFLAQDLEPSFDARRETVVVTGNNGNTDINSLDDAVVDDITFAGNAALYLVSNLVFYVHNGAIAGLGDGCGARTVAAEKARRMLEVSAYAALSADSDELWERVLYDTPFTREDFEAVIERPLRLTAFSDAFYPKADGFVETVGLDRIHRDFQERGVELIEGDESTVFIPKRNNFDPNYDEGLIPDVVVHPGGSLGDKVVVPMAENYGMRLVFTMTPEVYEDYTAGRKAAGRRFFGHVIM